MMRIALSVILLCLLACLVFTAPPKATVDPFTGKPLGQGKEVKPEHVVLITGASSGIGYATALEFARDTRYRVYATMRSPEKWEAPPAEDGVSWSNIVVKALDVTSAESVAAAVKEIAKAENGKIDIVVNNAGYGLAACLEGATVEEAQKLFDVNVWGVVRTLQEVLPYMRKRKDGHVINISSTSGIRGIPCMEYYAGSKFALEGIADSMRFSLAAYNISVTQINAGPVRTKFTEVYGNKDKGGWGTRAIPGDEEDGRYLEKFTQTMVDSLNSRMQSGEAQDQNEVARVIVNLAHMKDSSRKIVEVPFNIGTNQASQGVIEAVRKNPTGWTGMYAQLLGVVPPLEVKEEQSAKNSEREEL
jgi:NAD(P)-dependent dehydrogenase (short-subunit alcohol dehydrogenase family)